MAQAIAHLGVARLVLVDRDHVEASNLDRQCLYDEDDAREARPKAVAAAERLRRGNSGVEYVPAVLDLEHRRIRSTLAGVNLVLDGTDNFETRFLVNEYALWAGIPWVHAAVLGVSGQVFPVAAGGAPCYHCWLPSAPAPGLVETCETAGVLGPAVGVVASLAVAAGIRFLLGDTAHAGRLVTVNAWEARFGALRVRTRESCPACQLRRFPYLDGTKGAVRSRICGDRAVQIHPLGLPPPPLAELAGRLERVEKANEYLLKFAVENGARITLFADGRAIVYGTEDPDVARSLYSRYVGT